MLVVPRKTKRHELFVYFADTSLLTYAMTAETPPDTGRFRPSLRSGPGDDDCPRFIAPDQIEGCSY